MRVCGIVAEYNPFHLGHRYQIEQARRRLGEDTAVVCCMSGDFVQRGEAAILPKHLRAKAALLEGADLVIELPVCCALRSAEGFAGGAVELLLSTGLLTHLSFGAEDPDPALLRETAALLLEHRTVQDTLTQLKTGISYAAARERALFAQVREKAAILQKPNNILAVEYCKALALRQSEVEILPIPRQSPHDGRPEGGFASAGWLREQLRQGRLEQALPYLPPSSGPLLKEALAQGRALLDTRRLECAMLSQLIRLSPADFGRLEGASEGLSHRLWQSVRQQTRLEDICAAAHTRRYPLSRVRRMACCAFLGLDRRESQAPPAYLRVLGFSGRGRTLLRQMAKTARLPLITKPAHVQDLSPAAREMFSREALACDLYHLALPCWRDFRPGDDWRQSPVFLPPDGAGPGDPS